MEDSNDFRKFEEFVKQSFKEIMTSLQRQKMVIFSMVQNYSLLNLQPNQESTSLPNHQEPTITLQELSTRQELTIIF